MPEFTTFGYIQMTFLLCALAWGIFELYRSDKQKANKRDKDKRF